jgi:hypothetical protein|eukprot:COSAG01_NODE_1621_length_9711_cov_55.630292_1_plen_63_part_00
MTDDERVKIVKACKWVDEVAFDTPYQPSVATLDSVRSAAPFLPFYTGHPSWWYFLKGRHLCR